MKLEDQQRIDAPRERVFAALNDAEILRQCIPGCQTLDWTGDNQLEATTVLKVGPVKASFKGVVTLSDIVPPESYRISGEGSGGAAGFAKGGADVRLESIEDGQATLLHYNVDANIGGKLAQLGGRLIDSTARRLAAEFFAKFAAIVAPTPEQQAADQAEAAAPAPAPHQAAVASQASGTSPSAAARPSPSAAPAVAQGVSPGVVYGIGAVAVLALVLSIIALAT